MNSKRQANSPAEKIPESKKMFASLLQGGKPREDSSKGSLIRFEVAAIGDKPFYGSLAEIEIIHIWEKVLGRDRSEIYAMSYNRSLTRNFRVTFKLAVSGLTASSIYPESTFEYHRKPLSAESDDAVETLTCKFVGFSNVKPAELGQLTRVTAKTNEFVVDQADILNWLSKFGSVNTSNFDYERNSLGIRTDVLEVEILLKKHIPEYLPVNGRKVLINYPGIPKGCNNCYAVGHLKRNCRETKKDWIERVREMRDSGEYEDELFGGWIAILAQKK
jgi:hypothetical protein